MIRRYSHKDKIKVIDLFRRNTPKYFDPSEEADEAMIEELKREVDLVDDNLLAWLEQVALKAKATV